MKLLRKILFPFVPVYYLVTWIRNYFYDKGIFKSKSYAFPVICVGNLSVGGTGKTPMIEFLIRLLQDENKVAVLSRGYKRLTKGFQLANSTTKVEDIGDEPFQFFSKFSKVNVAVDSDRQNGIEVLKSKVNPDIVLLDDAFQHRKVKAGFNIMLSTYDNLYINDMLLPTGDLREPKSGAIRADVIIVTKCPNDLAEEIKQDIVRSIKPKAHQTVLFSKIKYSSEVFSKDNSLELNSLKGKKITLVTGIANPSPLLAYLKLHDLEFEHLNFDDHHNFTDDELKEIQSRPFVLTTEKDFMRLKSKVNNNLYYLPIEVSVNNKDKFESIIKTFLDSFKQK